ncbi:hypothetical protein TI39_contig358g00013 [Zymoseptoria brevis]|uniref:Uncharacterized protein n=1 Tax=Zymoseptoria brevis TaxID=1047168 RepID=A0A0F4GPU3_9PEZI|nr:hypothetical protein TI39_contig358g00013 [Zymoseptoria brevis]
MSDFNSTDEEQEGTRLSPSRRNSRAQLARSASPETNADILESQFWAIASQAEGIDIATTANNELIDDESGSAESDEDDRDLGSVEASDSEPDLDGQPETDEDVESEEDEDGQLLASDRGGMAAMRMMYKDLYREQGMVSMATKAMRTYPEDGKTLDSTSFLTQATSYHILLSTHPKILHSLLEGTLLADADEDDDLGRLLHKIRVRAVDNKFPQPAIYQNILASHSKKSPTPNELFEVANIVEAYCDINRDHTRAKRIDSFKAPYPKHTGVAYKARKYLTPERSLDMSQQRIKNVESFLEGLRKRIAAIDVSERDLPLKCPLVEIGYTHKSEKRLDDHVNHKGSNYIMNLFDAASKVLWPGKYKIHQFVVFLCTQAQQAAVAEILFTRLTQCYMTNGGGFTHYAPGRSNSSARKYNDEGWERFWDWNKKIVDVGGNLQIEESKWEAYVLKISQERSHSEKIVDEIKMRIESIRERTLHCASMKREMGIYRDTIQSASNDEDPAEGPL